MNAIQLELFESNDETALLRREISQIKDSQNRQRKAFFAKLNDLGKEIIECREEIERNRSLFLKRKK